MKFLRRRKAQDPFVKYFGMTQEEIFKQDDKNKPQSMKDIERIIADISSLPEIVSVWRDMPSEEGRWKIDVARKYPELFLRLVKDYANLFLPDWTIVVARNKSHAIKLFRKVNVCTFCGGAFDVIMYTKDFLRKTRMKVPKGRFIDTPEKRVMFCICERKVPYIPHPDEREIQHPPHDYLFE